MKKKLCIIISFILLFFTACNTAEPLVLPEEVESPSESSSIPIGESTPAPESSESEPKITDSSLESSETIVDPDFHKNYNMFLYGGTWSDDFNENVQRLTLHNKEYTDSSADKKKTFSYNGSDVQLVYQETIERFNDKCHVYKSEQGVEVWYDIKTNQLLFIDDRTFDVTGLTANEEECKNLAEKLIQKMMGVSLSDYTYSCETWYAKNFGEYQGVESKLVPYFHVMKEYQEELSDTGELLSYTEEWLSYTFIYTRYIDGYKTTDYISVEFLNNEFATGVIIRFDKSEFTNVVDIDLEYEDAKAAVESFCRAYFSDDREVISVDIEDCCLTFIEDKMYLDCSVVIEYSHKDRSYGILESILIEIE